ncbi:holin [Bifidobacterium pseudolongum subsp. globosum]|uniref:hypothetical protein n=1 Tax=Bifidobacterium pseudolongum TaxID=1694 RepID=UPI00101F735F|nr:hypothetical protein [Bifidobacterium pseudolongum]RYQ42381.1 holin [Bifidobacterium pseudolongum subsp. globosum]
MSDDTNEETTEYGYDDADQALPDSMPGTEQPYVPVFDPSVRTAIYVACTILGVILAVAAPVAIAAHAPEWATILLSAMAGAIPTVAAAFGVAYNPSRTN